MDRPAGARLGARFRLDDPVRLAALRRTGLLDTPAEARFDRLTRLATRIFDAPIALINLIAEDRQFFKSCVGLPEPWASRRGMPIACGFCQIVLANGAPVAITDARRDPALRADPVVAAAGVLAFAGVPLVTAGGQALGTFCVCDTRERGWSEHELAILDALVEATMAAIEGHAATAAGDASEDQPVSHPAERGSHVDGDEQENAERLVHAALAASDMGTFRWNFRTDELAWDDDLDRLFGLPAGHTVLSVAQCMELIHPDDVASTFARAEQCAEDGTDFDREFRVVWPDGSVHWLLARGKTIRDATGRPSAMTGACTDITGRKRVEEELARRARQLALAADVGSALTQGDALRDTLQRCAEAAVRHLDAAFARIWTLRPGEDVLILQASAGMYTHLNGPHGRVTVGEMRVGHVASERRPHLTNDVVHDPHISDRNWAEREGMVAFAGYPLVVDERLVGVMALFARHPLMDDTLAALASVADAIGTGIVRKWAEAAHEESDRALREERETLATLNRVGQLLAAELDLNTLVQAVIDAATTLTGAAFGAFLSGELNPAGRRYTLSTLAGAPRETFTTFYLPHDTALFGPTFRGEGVVRLADVREDPRYGQSPPYYGVPPGHPPIVSYLAVPVVARTGTLLGGLFFGHPDGGIFDERAEHLARGLAAQAGIAIENARLYGEAQEAVRLRDAVLATVSHDLKNPLAAIQGQTQILRRQLRRTGNADPDRLAAGLAGIGDMTTRMVAQINELLDTARLRAGQPLELQRAAVDLVALTRQVATEHQGLTDRHAIAVEAPDAALIGQWDRVRVERVVANLVTNAIKYSPDGGPVALRVEGETVVTRPWAKLTVRDQGIGIPAADLPHVFEPFRRGSNVVGRIAGSGIGLSGARQIVAQHGGEITVASDEGIGTTITVWLPRDAADEPAHAR